jgi:capsular exopolysaccharide synthesis family protein
MKDELVVFDKPKSSLSENIRTIRTNLEFTAVNGGLKTILITSSISGEGKSFIASNLAVAFAQTGKRVLLVDCDIRKGRLHKIFNVDDNNLGLSNLLIDDDLVNDIEINGSKYIIETRVNNLYMIPRGTIAPNPSELLGSPRASRLLEILKKKFDYIILDCGPTIGLPDALILARIADKVVIVSSLNYTPMDMLVNTKKSLENVNANIAGIVVNKVKGSSSSYYSKYYE